jgi:very-short-patch-repair endonuclease
MYGASCVEEEPFPVDLHDYDSELWPKKSMRNYQADLVITKKKGKKVYRVIAEIDGPYHYNLKQAERDAVRDVMIPQQYRIQVVRFDKIKLIKGEYSEEEIAGMLGMIGEIGE